MKGAVETILVDDSKKLYVFFGGISGGMTGKVNAKGEGTVVPPFEFYKSAQVLEENRIFIRDPYQCWYHRGLPEAGPNIDAIAGWLTEQISQIAPDEVVFVGNSMGGFAAILFSTMVNVSRVVAFSPQTFIDAPNRLHANDSRWATQLNRLYSLGEKYPRYFDLLNELQRTAYRSRIAVFTSEGARLDRIHAQHIKDYATEYSISGDNHATVRLLRSLGQLPSIINGDFF